MSGTTIDLTGIAVAVVGGIFSVGGSVFLLWLQSHMKDQAAAATLSATIKNSLGAIQQSVQSGIRVADPRITLPASVPAPMLAGVQYVLDHAGDEAKRLGVTQDAMVSKISAQIGLANIATNTATAASPAPTPKPLDPVAAPTPAATPKAAA